MCTTQAFRCARERFSNLLNPLRLRLDSRRGGAVRGNRRRTGDPPLFACRIGKTVPTDVHCPCHRLGGRSRLIDPYGKARRKNEDRVDLVPPDPLVAPEPRPAHQADREPDARRGGDVSPEPPGCEETQTNQRSLQRGTELRLDDVTPLWTIKDFPQGASFCLQFNRATDLPSFQPHPCRFLSPLDRRKQDRVLPIAQVPDLADHLHLTGAARAEKSPFPRAALEAPGHRPGAYTQPPVRSLWVNTGQMAGLVFRDLTRIPAGGGFKRHLGGGRIRAGLRAGAGILREGPILMVRDKEQRPVQRRNGDPARVLAPRGGRTVPRVLDLLQLGSRILSKVRDDPLVKPPGRGSSQMGGRGRGVFALEDLNADAGSLGPWYDSPHGEEPGFRKEEMQGHSPVALPRPHTLGGLVWS